MMAVAERREVGFSRSGSEWRVWRQPIGGGGLTIGIKRVQGESIAEFSITVDEARALRDALDLVLYGV